MFLWTLRMPFWQTCWRFHDRSTKNLRWKSENKLKLPICSKKTLEFSREKKIPRIIPLDRNSAGFTVLLTLFLLLLEKIFAQSPRSSRISPRKLFCSKCYSLHKECRSDSTAETFTPWFKKFSLEHPKLWR